MAFGVYEQTRYKVEMRDPDGTIRHEVVEGVRIGRFGVRVRDPNDTQSTRKYAIDHIPTGLLLITSDDFNEAVRIADDVSRFSAKDPSSKVKSRAARQVGEKLHRWLVAQDKRLERGLPLQDYREFYRS